ncbi:MAG: FTR1 family protein [Chthoniobacteraceae bacterium]
MKRIVFIAVMLGLLGIFQKMRADMTDDFHHIQQRTDAALLDIYEGNVPPETEQELRAAWLALDASLDNKEAHALVVRDFSHTSPEDLAAKLGTSRGLLQQIAALEVLENQRAGRAMHAQEWRVLIMLPQFANADDGGLLLHQPPEQAGQSGVTEALAKEYVTWQVSRVRQLFDRLQRAVANDDVNEALLRANLSEIQTLSRFPQSILQAAGINNAGAGQMSIPALQAPYSSDASTAQLVAWRGKVEATLPNLLKPEDVTRLQRLLVRFVVVVPKEYHNGVEGKGNIVIPLEYREAVQFTQQAQGLVNELSPVWSRDLAVPYQKYHAELVQKLATLAKQIDRVEELPVIESTAKEAGAILEDKFGLSARRSGDKGQIVEETALDVREALNNSLAAAQAGHWQEAESLRLDAYTSFDSEIETRVLPRNPTLATRTERSFIDGGNGESGIKALIDRSAPIEELTAGYDRALKNMDECVAILKVSISPATVGFTAFTIIAREGLEAIIVLAALLAGMRTEEQKGTRHWVSSGAWLAILASAITFWLSKTLIHSLSRYGEKLEAVVSILAVIILLMVTNWVFHKFYWVGWNAKLRSLSKASQKTVSDRWEWLALLGVGFLTVYREGFETTLFMQSLLLEGSVWPVVIGVLAGAAFITVVGLGIFTFGAKLPYRKLLVVTGVLVVSIMVTFFGSTVRLFQTVGWMPIHPIPWLTIPNWSGLWLGLYPSWEGILIPPLALVYVCGAWLWVKFSSSKVPLPPPPEQPVLAKEQVREPVAV